MSERRSGRTSRMLALVVALVVVVAGGRVALADWRQGEIHFKDGRKLTGSIEERGGQVALKGRFGETLFERKNIDRIEYSGGESAGGVDAPEGESGLWLLRLNDGRELRAERYLDKGTSVVVMVGGVEFTISKQQIVEILKLDVGTTAVAETADVSDPSIYQDIAAGFAIAAPGPDWRIERQPSEPLVRVEMINDHLGARIGVKAFPVSEDMAQFIEVNEANAAAWATKVSLELAGSYGRSVKAAASVVEFQGVDVYQFDYRVNAVGTKTPYRTVELRFFQDDLLLILDARALAKNFDDAMFEKLRWAQRTFSRLGNLIFTPRTYVDRALGYQLQIASGPWTLDLSLFDAVHPVRVLLPEADEANVTVGLELRSGEGTAADWIDAIVSKRSSGSASYFRLKEGGVRTWEVGGSQVVTVEFEDFPEKKTQLEDFQSTVVAVGGVLVHLYTRVAQTDEAKAARDQAADLHANLAPVGISQLIAQIERERDSQNLFISGLEAWREKRFEEAMGSLQAAAESFEGYYDAWLLASQAARDAKLFSEALVFLGKASDLSPSVELEEQKHKLLREAFNQAKKDKKFKEAVGYLKDALRLGDPDNKGAAELEKIFIDWARALVAAKKFKEATRIFDDGLRETGNAKKVQDAYIKMLTSWASGLVREQKFRDAKRAAKRAARVSRDPKDQERIQKLLDTITKAEEKARQG